MRRAAKIINLTCDQIVKGSSAHLHYDFKERSGYIRDDQGRAKFSRRRQVTESFKMEPKLRTSLADWLTSEPTRRPLRLTTKNIDVVITWRGYVHPLLNTFCTMPSLAYDLRENPLYQVLKSKSDQLRKVPNGVYRGIFLGDAGCQLFNNIDRVDRVNHTYSGQQIIEEFLACENTVDFVAVFSVKRAKENSWHAAKNPRLWYLYLFEQKTPPDRLDLGPILRLRDLLPVPYVTGYEARLRHEQGMFSPEARGRYLPTSMSTGRQSMTVRISARALQELMAGRLRAEQFENWAAGCPNPFEQHLALGWIISSVSFEPKDTVADDDYLTFTFKEDPAAAALRLPDKLQT
jgi:hypothetical protein